MKTPVNLVKVLADAELLGRTRGLQLQRNTCICIKVFRVPLYPLKRCRAYSIRVIRVLGSVLSVISKSSALRDTFSLSETLDDS